MTGAKRQHEVWVLIRDYGPPSGEEPEAAFFSRRELEAWVTANGGWEPGGQRYYVSVTLPETPRLTFPTVAS